MFCENCGHTVPDTAAHCPSCGQATGATTTPPIASAAVSSGAAPAPARSSSSETPLQRTPPLTRAEQNIYFRVARGFSWFLLIVISIGIIVVGIQLIPAVKQGFGVSTSVNSQELTKALTSSQHDQRQYLEEEEESEINPAEMAQLDQTAYEIIQLLPAEQRSDQGTINLLSMQLKNTAASVSSHRDVQLAMMKELRDDLPSIQADQREKAVEVYFRVKRQKVQLDVARKARARESLTMLGAALFGGIAVVTLVTMILVLLAIERNTRLRC